MIRQVMVDTVSNVLGIIDGTTPLPQADGDLELRSAGMRIDGDLQDEFLALEEG